ncbi:MAG: hypothetical protein HOB97_05135 [Verrucomicrobia bacterium]|nr:hypothetical protein [Verrucomicrobiota bacterium]
MLACALAYANTPPSASGKRRLAKCYSAANSSPMNAAPARSHNGIVPRLTSVVTMATCVATTGLPP